VAVGFLSALCHGVHSDARLAATVQTYAVLRSSEASCRLVLHGVGNEQYLFP